MDPISISLMGVGLLGQIAGGIFGMQDQEKMMRTEQSRESFLAQRDRLAQVRQARTAMANIQQAGANQGVGASSSVAGGASSAYTQAGGNIQTVNSLQELGQTLTKERMAYTQAQGLSQLGQGISSIGSSMFDLGQKGVFGG